MHVFRVGADASVEEGCDEGLGSLGDDVVVKFLRIVKLSTVER